MDEKTIRKWYSVFKDDSQLTEIRILNPLAKGKETWSGYFTDVDTMLDALKGNKDFDKYQIYFTLNKIKDACYSRLQRDKFVKNPTTTSGTDIEGRDWCLIDVDVIRPSDTNATDEEIEEAKRVARRVFVFLRDQGFEAPVSCMSGNGVHLLYKQSMANNDKNTQTMKLFLSALDMMFSTERAHVDIAPHDPNRICKLYGTMSRKGSNAPDRPHRLSVILNVPDEIKVTPNEYFEKVAAILPEPEKPSRYNNYSRESFDINSFLTMHNIKVAKRSRFACGEKIVLEECPFDSSHRAPDSALFVMDSGAVAFKCLHNSHAHLTFRDFRMFYDPHAYDKKDYYAYRQRMEYNSPRTELPLVPEVKEESQDKGKKWLSMTDIAYVDPTKMPSIPTGITALDEKITGLMLGDLTILSGLSGAGKTSLIDILALNAVQKGFKVAIWSGELQGWRFQSWINQMAAGKAFVKARQGYDNLYFAPRHICDEVNKWLDGKLWLYNNSYGQKWSQLFSDIKECVEETGAQMLVLDNLMALGLDPYQGEKNEKQTAFINDLKNFAKDKNITIILVCHPRKEASFQLLRKESIAGTADITNLADNVIIIHRVGRDFVHRAKEFYGQAELDNIIAMDYDALIEICKNRSFGITDCLIGLYFEPESRRYKNDIAEHIIYGWQELPSQTAISNFDIGDLPEEFA